MGWPGKLSFNSYNKKLLNTEPFSELLGNLFSWKIRTRSVCHECGKESSWENSWNTLPLPPVIDPCSLQELIGNFMQQSAILDCTACSSNNKREEGEEETEHTIRFSFLKAGSLVCLTLPRQTEELRNFTKVEIDLKIELDEDKYYLYAVVLHIGILPDLHSTKRNFSHKRTLCCDHKGDCLCHFSQLRRRKSGIFAMIQRYLKLIGMTMLNLSHAMPISCSMILRKRKWSFQRN